MTCRSLLWITAAAASVGAATSTASIAVAAEAAAGWIITIDEPTTEVVASKHLLITGSASHEGAVPDGVTVTVVPQGLPPQCGPASGPATMAGDRYTIELDVACNGPHQIQVLAQSPSSTASAGPHAIGVAEPPPRPPAPALQVTGEGGIRATWDPTTGPDADGTILMVNLREDHYPTGTAEATLPPADRRAAIALRSVRWGAGGPGTTISSPESDWRQLGDSNPHEPHNPDDTEPPPPPPDPDPEPDPTPSPTPTPPAPAPGKPSSSADPPGPTTDTPTTSTTVPPATLPAGPSEEMANGAKPAIVPGSEPDRRPAVDSTERAISTAAPVGGLVRTTENQPLGLVRPLALGLLVITIAAHLTWHLHRSRSTVP
jgi:hypothetical protein